MGSKQPELLDRTGGSAKQARDRQFQAILPLRGKILNVERKDDAALYKNNEISNLIVALGLGLKGEEMLNLRYGKVNNSSSPELGQVLALEGKIVRQQCTRLQHTQGSCKP